MTAASPPALLPCPFCGNPGSLFQKRPWSDDWRVCCDQNEQGQCPAFGDYSTPEEAIAAWNRRATDPAVPELVEALEAARRITGSHHAYRGPDNSTTFEEYISDAEMVARALLAKHAAKQEKDHG